MKRPSLLTIAALSLMAACTTTNIDISVTNETTFARHDEMLELEVGPLMGKLGIDNSDELVVLESASGERVVSQVTYDGKLIFLVSLEGGESAEYNIVKGEAVDFEPRVFGAQFPVRIDDFAWENDCIAFRIYGPALQATGEQSYGNDVWVKRVPELVVAHRYEISSNPETLRKIDSLKECDIVAARRLSSSISVHADHGNGMDYYKVGSTLGAGGAALMDGEEIIYPYCYKDYEILDNGPLRITAKFTYNPATIGDSEGVVETRTTSLDAGSFLNKTTLHYSNLTKPHRIIAGAVMNEWEDEAKYTLSPEGGYAAYADIADKGREKIQETTFVATLFGDAATEVAPYYFTPEESSKLRQGSTGYAAVFGEYKPESIFTYYWGAAWSKYTIKSYDEWVKYVDRYASQIKQPLTVKIK